MKAMSIVDVLRNVNRDYESRAKKISTPNNEAYEALKKEVDVTIHNFQIQQIKAYKEAERIMFL